MKYLITLLSCILCTGVFAQSIDALRVEISKAEKEIKINTELLEKNQKNQKTNLTQLKLLQSRIYNRKKLINSLQSQINLTNKDITTNKENITDLENEVKKLKNEYSDMLYSSYKNYKLNNFLVFLFASEDFNDITKRIAFMKRYNNMRKDKSKEIDSISMNLKARVEQLNNQMISLSDSKTSHGRELNSMADDERKYKKTASTLKASASQISKTVKAKQSEINKAQNKIQSIIAEEAKKAKERTAKQSAEEKEIDIKLTGAFDQNKGKLPYPVRDGVIIDSFGVHAHPTQKGLMVNNKGINIAGSKGAGVRCVFEGVVTRVFFFKGLNNNIMVRHGNYITVYSNLDSVDVKTGDKVQTNQVIGKLSLSNNPDECMLHFEIWKETVNLNPTYWLRR